MDRIFYRIRNEAELNIFLKMAKREGWSIKIFETGVSWIYQHFDDLCLVVEWNGVGYQNKPEYDYKTSVEYLVNHGYKEMQLPCFKNYLELIYG